METANQDAWGTPSATTPSHSPLAPVMMVTFWMLLGGAAGIRAAQSIWHLLGVDVGSVAVAVPLGGALGALAGALLGLISNPRMLVLLMAVFAGSAAGAVAGKVPWGEIGEIGGQFAGAAVGGIAWATWLFIELRNESSLGIRVLDRLKARAKGEAADLNALPPKQRLRHETTRGLKTQIASSTEVYPVGNEPGRFLAKMRSDADDHQYPS